MEHVYHGTIQKDLAVIKPFKRFTPGSPDLADQIPPRIYATYNPAYAVAHSFPWSSDDGVDIKVEGETICIVVPKEKAAVLKQPICVYTLPVDSFTHTTEEDKWWLTPFPPFPPDCSVHCVLQYEATALFLGVCTSGRV